LRAERIGLVFFDEGHGEYRTLYRRARVFLSTGSERGDWGAGKGTKNLPLPLDNFTKDANTKESEHCFFIQLKGNGANVKGRGGLAGRGSLCTSAGRVHGHPSEGSP
jgi:hypothetical protein